jgi:hypothetical protein
MRPGSCRLVSRPLAPLDCATWQNHSLMVSANHRGKSIFLLVTGDVMAYHINGQPWKLLYVLVHALCQDTPSFPTYFRLFNNSAICFKIGSRIALKGGGTFDSLATPPPLPPTLMHKSHVTPSERPWDVCCLTREPLSLVFNM